MTNEIARGDVIVMTVPYWRWWERLLFMIPAWRLRCWLWRTLHRIRPVIHRDQSFTVTGVEESTSTVTIESGL